MKIAITGSHGVGKTTLAKLLAEHLDIYLIKEVAREIMEQWNIEPWQLPPSQAQDYQQAIIDRQIQREEQTSDLESFVIDRTGFDCLGYSKGLDSYQQLADQWLLHNIQHPYDLVIRIPIHIQLDPDGRSLDPIYQQYIDNSIIEQLEKHGQPYYTIKGQSTPEQRLEEVLKLL